MFKIRLAYRNYVKVQWLGLCTSTAGDVGSIPGRGSQIPQAFWCGQKKKKKTKKLDSWLKPSFRCAFGSVYLVVGMEAREPPKLRPGS